MLRWWALLACVVVFAFVLLVVLWPPHSAKPAAAPPALDHFRILGSWPLAGDESLRLVHIPDAPTGLRCLIYQNPKQTVVQCDDDLPR